MKLDSEVANKVVEAYEAEVKNFARCGAPVVFGRLEGMKELAEILGLEEEVKTFIELQKFYHADMARHCR